LHVQQELFTVNSVIIFAFKYFS